MSGVSYSPDGGKSWIGPLSHEEFAQLKASGMINPDFIVRNDGDAAAQGAMFYAMLGGRQQGPYTTQRMQEMLSEGSLSPASMVWRQGMPNWVPVSELLPQAAAAPAIAPVAAAAPTVAPVAAAAEPQVADAQPLEQGPDEFSFSHFISGIFTGHTHDDMVDFFCAGSSSTTPPIRSVSATWPSPWVFARVLVFFVALCAMLYWGLKEYQNTKIIPAIIMVGSMGVPLSVLLLVYELNIRRDVPFYMVMKTFMLGGVLSLLFTMFLNKHFSALEAAYWAGPIEETAKLFAVLFTASHYRKNGILTGVLLGCAIGAGFAAFETMGYVFEALLPILVASGTFEVLHGYGAPAEVLAPIAQHLQAHINDPDETLFMRGLLAPAGHVVWTAITAGVFWAVMGEKVKARHRAASDTGIDFSILKDTRFLSIVWVPVVLHMVWNSGLFLEHGWWKFVALGFVGWALLLRLVQKGINQVKYDKAKLSF